jgi:hypothetical protein
VSAADESDDLLLPGRGFATHHWTQVPEWVTLADVSDRATRLYTVLAAHVNHRRELPDGTPDRRSFPGQKRIASMLRCSPDRVRLALRELENIDAIATTVVRWGPNRMKRRNLYTVHLDPPRGYRGEVSITRYGHENPQVSPNPLQTRGPVPSSTSDQPPVVTTGTPTKSKNTPPARRHAPRDGVSADRTDQRDLTEQINDAMTTDGMSYDDAARWALADAATNDGIDGGWVEGLIDSMLDRGDVPAKILHTVRKTAEEYMS